MFILKVKHINGEINSLDLENGEDSLVFDVKSRLSQLIEVEVERIRLIYIGRVLKDDEKLKDYGITEESTIQCIIRPIEVPPSNPHPNVNINNNVNVNNNNNSERPIFENTPQFRNLGNGILMGSLTLDGTNLSSQTPNLTNIINQMVSLAQNIVSSETHPHTNTFTPPTSSSSFSFSSSSQQQPPQQQTFTSELLSALESELSTPSSPSESSSPNTSNLNSDNVHNLHHLPHSNPHLLNILQSLPQASSQIHHQENDNLISNLNNLFLVLHGLEIPLMNLLQQLPQNDPSKS